MSDAYYYRGLTIEFDLSVPRMRIEGRELLTKDLSALFALSDPPDVKSNKLRRYGERSIEQWPGFEKREAARRNPRDLAAACSGGKFVVSGSGEAYSAQARGPDRKFWMYSDNHEFPSNIP
jgi:hypothetical protein